ncbi:MAG: bifunctional phosphoserine phosphatase/homoserine phosphotransferase ThrH [Caldilineales bacterium]|nr:bifunctional phosphoserine phosphatase/homoserine phosphotransferase ThrH [Caldilineales bacterium]
MLPPLTVFDLEGVFTPEIWIAVAETTGIPALRRTTRDEPDYDKLMRARLAILAQHGLSLRHIQEVIAELEPLPGACDFLGWMRAQTPVILLSDTFAEFAAPLMAKLGRPTLFCNSLEIDSRGLIVDYHLRLRDGKRAAVQAFKQINYRVIAAGDSYNDATMLAAADHGILFRPPPNMMAEFPQFPVAYEYDELKALLINLLSSPTGP